MSDVATISITVEEDGKVNFSTQLPLEETYFLLGQAQHWIMAGEVKQEEE